MRIASQQAKAFTKLPFPAFFESHQGRSHEFSRLSIIPYDFSSNNKTIPTLITTRSVVVITLSYCTLAVLSNGRVFQRLRCLWKKFWRPTSSPPRTAEEKFNQEQRRLAAQLGRTLKDFALTHNKLGKALQEERRYDEALKVLRKGLKIEKECFERDDHPQMGSTYRISIACVLQEQGKYRQAMKQLKKALRAQGPDHPESGETFHAMGEVLLDQDLNEKAMKQFEKALAIKLKAHGPKHASTGEAYLSIGMLLDDQGKYEEAVDQFQKGLSIMLKARGPKHPDTGEAYLVIGLVLLEQKKYEEAMKQAEKAQKILSKAHGPEHPDTGDAYFLLGTILAGECLYDEAKKQCQKAHGIYQKVYGPNDRRTKQAGRALMVLERPLMAALLALFGL